MDPTQIDGPKSKRQKRPRAIQACELCRLKKYKCDEGYPCSYCVAHRAECVYVASEITRRNPRTPTAPSHKDLEALERRVVELRAILAAAPRSRDLPPQECPSQNIGNAGAVHIPERHRTPSPESYAEAQTRTASVFQNILKSGSAATVNATTFAENNIEKETVTETSDDVTDTNPHTNSIEFYGGSSSIAFLRQVQIKCDVGTKAIESGVRPSLVSMLYNTAFSPLLLEEPAPRKDTPIDEGRFYFRVSTKFLDGYFENIHHIQPILEKDEFVTRCEDLWFGRSQKQTHSFHALYYSVMSLGALVRVWDKSTICGMDRFQWSRKLFAEARLVINRLGTTTDLEMVQCLFIMAKICQHELNHHMSYLYIGQSVRTALAIGLNRQPSVRRKEDEGYSKAAWKTWWGLYVLDNHTSFALGRPDTLGADAYHNRRFPGTDQLDAIKNGIGSPDSPELAIVPALVDHSRITRRICPEVYMSKAGLHEKLHQAKSISAELDGWIDSLPSHLRPTTDFAPARPLKAIGGFKYLKKQKLVLMIRYHNSRMILFGYFLAANGSMDRSPSPLLTESIQKCIDSAIKTIDAIHETFCNDDYFQAWWYNSTYILFAVTIILICIFRAASEAQDSLFQAVNRAIAVLDAMDECVVTKNAGTIIKRTLARAKEYCSLTHETSHPGAELQHNSSKFGTVQKHDQFPAALASGEHVGESLFRFDSGADDDEQALFWKEWANSLDMLGAPEEFGGMAMGGFMGT